MGLFGPSKKDNRINAFLGSGTEFSGDLQFSGTVRIDGRFTGSIRSEGVLVLGRSAVIEGEIIVGRLSSNGTIRGNVTVLEKAWLQANSRLEGSLKTARLEVENGALVEGSVSMSDVPKALSSVSEAALLDEADTDSELAAS